MRAALNRASTLYGHQLFWPVSRLVFFAIIIFIALTQYIVGWAYLSPEPGTIPVGQSADFTVITNRGELELVTIGAYRLDCETNPESGWMDREHYATHRKKARVHDREQVTLYACVEGTGGITLYQPGFGETVASYPVSLTNGEYVDRYRFIPGEPAGEWEPSFKWEAGRVSMETGPSAEYTGHHLDFTDLEGRLVLRLDFDDAAIARRSDRTVYTWGACTQPWLDGEKLWARILASDEQTLTHVTNDALPCSAIAPRPEPAPIPQFDYSRPASSTQPLPRSWWPPSYKMWCAEPTGCPIFGWVVLLPSALCMAHSMRTIFRWWRQRTRTLRRVQGKVRG